MGVSIQQAACNAAVAYLRTKLPGLQIHARWPGQDFPGKAITLITAGSRQDQPLEPRILSKTNQGDTQTNAVWQIAHCSQPVQLDIWAKTWDDRDSLLADMDRLLRGGFSPMPAITFGDPIGAGLWVSLQDGWEATETTAYFSFQQPDFEDIPESIGRDQYRAIYRGNVWMMLSIPAVSFRQKTINLTSILDGADRDTTVIDEP